MKKSSLIITGLVAVLCTSLFATGVAFAYTKFDADRDNAIYLDGTPRDVYLYKRNPIANINLPKAGETYTYTFDLGAVRKNYIQDSYVVKMTVMINASKVFNDYFNNSAQGSPAINVKIDGYAPNTFFANNNVMRLMDNSGQYNLMQGFVAFPLGFETTYKATISFTLPNDQNYVNSMFPCGLHLNVTLDEATEPDSYQYAYIRGINGDWNSNKREYRMVPSLDTPYWCWEHKFIDSHALPANNEFKCASYDGKSWAGDPNYKTNSGISNTKIYWNQGNGNNITVGQWNK